MAERVVNLDVDLLRAFVTVVETGSFTRAAALLGRTQPAVSLQIRRLEDQLRSPLVDRKGKGVGLTTEGAALLPQARRLLRLNDEIVSTLGDGDLEGEVRFGAPEDIATVHLPGILGAFARSHPRIRRMEAKSAHQSASSSRPPGALTRRSSRSAAAGSGQSCSDELLTTRSNARSAKGSAPASACARARGERRAAPSSMARERSMPT